MRLSRQAQLPVWPALAWSCVAVLGIAAPAVAIALLTHGGAHTQPMSAASPILAIGLMSAGMVGAAAASSLWVGLLLAMFAGICLLGIASVSGLPVLSYPLAAVLALTTASISFAARGSLFARSATSKGWWIAFFVVAGEAAILISAFVQPGLWPDWLLVLLPAQWANLVIQAALSGHGALAAISALIALAGTAAATLLVAYLWPRRWPYAIMFTTWIALSTLVYHYPAPGTLQTYHSAPSTSPPTSTTVAL